MRRGGGARAGLTMPTLDNARAEPHIFLILNSSFIIGKAFFDIVGLELKILARMLNVWSIMVYCVYLHLMQQCNKYKCMLTQDDAERLLSIPKVIVDKGSALSSYVLDFSKSRDFRLFLSPSDSINKDAEFLLRIRVSEKMRVKASLHTQENETNMCIFRLDFNGAPHTNPAVVNEYVPDKFAPFAGKVLMGNHVHYYVQGYKTAAWALPIEEDTFPVKRLTEDGFSKELKDILDALADIIHLESKIILVSRMMLNGMD